LVCFLIVDLLQVELGARLSQHDVGRQRAGAGRKIKLHYVLLENTGQAGARDLASAGHAAQAVIALGLATAAW
jgi:hypothetical protein